MTGSDNIPFPDYFGDLCVPQMALDLPIKRAHRHACHVLEQAFLGLLPEAIKYIVINMPRRVGKTKIMEALYSWGWGYFGDAQFIHTSYNQNLTSGSMQFVSRILNQPWYKEFFGDFIHHDSDELISTIYGGQLHAAGTGGTLTGKGGGLKRPAGGLITIDDPSKPDEALSLVEIRAIIQWFETTIKGCRNSDRWCPIVIMQQRLGNDLSRYVRETYPDNTLVVRYPMLVDPETGQASTADNAISAFPETRSAADILSLRSTRTGRFVLATQWQQEDATLGGNLIPMGEFERWDPADAANLKFERSVITVDTALKTKQANDFSCCALWGLLKKKAYLIDLMHGKWESPELLHNVGVFWEKWKGVPTLPRPKLIIEEKAAGTPLIQYLKTHGIPAQGIERDIDKVRRIKLVLPYIETHMCVIPKTGSTPWIAKWETEHAEFKEDGTHAHDDMCLVAGSLVACRRGMIPIERVLEGDEVITRAGWRRVEWSGMTGYATELVTVSIRDRSITATAAHPIWTEERGFCRVDTISDGMTLRTCDVTEQPVPPTSWCSMELSSDATPHQPTIPIEDTIHRQLITDESVCRLCTRKSGKVRMEKYHQTMTCITKIETPSTIHQRILSASQNESTLKSTEMNWSRGVGAKAILPGLEASAVSLLNGTDPQKAGNGTGSMVKLRWQNGKRRPAIASSAQASFSATTQMRVYARKSVLVGIAERQSLSICDAIAAVMPSSEPQWILERQNVCSVRASATPTPVPVFNLKVEGEHEFFANGILVHNCDTTADAIEELLGKRLSGFDVLYNSKH